MADNVYEKLDNFTSVITDDAKEKSSKIYSEIEQTRKDTLAQAEDDVLNESFKYIKNCMDQIQTEIGRKVSKKSMENKRNLNLRREQMKNNVMNAVTQKIDSYVNTTEYLEYLKASIIEIVDSFESDAIVYICPNDMVLVDKLKEVKSKFKFDIKAGNFELGGLRAECPSKHMQIDKSFDTEMDDASKHFYELFGIELAN